MPRYRLHTAICITAATLAVSIPVFAQPDTGLIDETRVMAELGNRGMETLLKRDFAVNNTPVDQQNGIITLMSLRKLDDPKLSEAEKQKLIRNICAGITAALPSLKDPLILQQQAFTLVDAGIKPQLNLLEYWGDNPRTRAELGPVVTTVQQLLGKSADIAGKEADRIANKMNNPNDKELADQWQKYADLQASSQYSSTMFNYEKALSLSADDPKRKEIADKTLDALQQYDTADSGIQAAVRDRMAKLNMVKGDYDTAIKIFAEIIKGDAGEIKPAPGIPQQYQARYFTVVCDIQAKNFDAADKAASELDSWQKANFKSDDLSNALAAFSLLQYREISAKADAATSDADKLKLNNQAIAVLLDLLKQQPGRRSTILELVMTRLPDNPDVTTLDPLLLLALQQKAEQEYAKPEGQKVDAKVLERGISAAQELTKRKGKDGVDDKVVMRAVYVIPYFQEKLDQKPEAAASFLDYADKYKGDNDEAKGALDQARALIAQLKQADNTDQNTKDLYDRFLPLAINPPYNRKEFANEYGMLLYHTGKPADAVQYFQMVPADSPQALSAHYFEMLSLKKEIDDENTKLDAQQRKDTVAQIQTLADQVTQQATEAAAKATTDTDRKRYTGWVVRTKLMSADLAKNEQKDPAKTVQLLDGFENTLGDFSDEDRENLIASALALRVSSFMELGQSDKATDALVTLLKTQNGPDGAKLIFNMLPTLDAEREKATKAGDTATAARLAANRATLSSFLVNWAQNNPDPKIKENLKKYQAFDASNQLLAGDLTTDADQKKALYQKALDAYKKLLDPNATTDDRDNNQVLYSIGVLQYQLGDYAGARDTLQPLIAGKKLGDATQMVVQNGVPAQVENTTFWEGHLRWMQSVAKIAEAKSDDADAQKLLEVARTKLKQLYVEWPQTIGGTTYHDEYEALRKQITPDFDPEKLLAPATQPAT